MRMKRSYLLFRRKRGRILGASKIVQPSFSRLHKGQDVTTVSRFATTTTRAFSDSAGVTVRKDEDARSVKFSFEEAIAKLPEGAQLHLDFFGEPVSFFGITGGDNIENVVASLDRFVIGIASKGKAFTGKLQR